MSQFIVSEAAEEDLTDIWLYVAQQRSIRTADRLTARVIGKFPSLALHPGMGRRREELGVGIRSFPVGNYVIFYKPTEDGISILRVLHGARDIENAFATPGE